MTAAKDNSAPAATGAENGGETVSTHIIGWAWRRVKAWALARIYPAVVLEVQQQLICTRCKRPITPDDLFVWDSRDYHKGCLAQLRGWRLEAEDPADVLPDRSINRYQPDAREPGYTLPSSTTVH